MPLCNINDRPQLQDLETCKLFSGIIIQNNHARMLYLSDMLSNLEVVDSFFSVKLGDSEPFEMSSYSLKQSTVVCLLVDPGHKLFCGHFLSLNNV